MAPTHTRRAAPALDAAELFDRLDAAMRLWPRRHLEPAQLVEKTLDRLHEAWAELRITIGDELEAPPPRSATATKRQRAKDERPRTRSARARKAVDDEQRERYIVKRYAVHIRRATSAKVAREAVADEVRRGLYLTRYSPEDWEFVPPYYTYSEKSVARVLRKYDTR